MRFHAVLRGVVLDVWAQFGHSLQDRIELVSVFVIEWLPGNWRPHKSQ